MLQEAATKSIEEVRKLRDGNEKLGKVIDQLTRDGFGGISGDVGHLAQSCGPIIRRSGSTDSPGAEREARMGSRSGGNRIERGMEIGLDGEMIKYRRIRFELWGYREERIMDDELAQHLYL